MITPLTFICPGQGAQTVGMGKAWADASPAAKAIFDRADAVLGDRLGLPLSILCFEGPADRLNATDAAQPAIYTCSIASLAGWCEANGTTPDTLPLAATAGLSLGEYTALHVAGAIGFEDGLELVTLRGRAMQDAAEASASGMVALIGADEAQAQAVTMDARQDGVLVCANFNAPGQVVLSGDAAACDRAETVAQEHGLRAARLQVAGAFHSPLMQPAADRLAEALAKTPIHQPRCPVLSNVTAAPHGDSTNASAEAYSQSVRTKLAAQLISPVRWSDSCLWLGANVKDAATHELAPGKTLSGLMRRIDRSIKVTAHDLPDTLATT